MDEFKGRENMLKAIATLVSLVAVGLTAGSSPGSYFKTSEDEFALAMTILAFIYTAVVVILIVLKKMPATTQSHKIEASVSFVFVVLVTISAIVFLVRTSQLTKFVSNSRIVTRVFASIFQLAIAGNFAWILYEIYKKIKK